MGEQAADTGLGWFGEKVANAVNAALDYVLDALSKSNAATGLDQSWFGSQYDMMLQMGFWVMVPLIICSVIQGIAKSSMEQMIKSVLFYPLIATAGAIVAVEIVRLLVVITDDISELFNNSSREKVTEFFNLVKGGFDPAGAQTATSDFGAANERDGRTLFLILIGIGILLASGMTAVILAIRDASIYIATLFLPIGFAMMVWPATIKWFRRISELLLAVILSKVVIVATIAIGVSAAMAAIGPGNGDPTVNVDGSTIAAGATQAGDDTFQWIYLSLFALTVLIFAVYSPNATSKMISLALDDAAGAFQGLSNRPTFVSWAAFGSRMFGLRSKLSDTSGLKAQYKAQKNLSKSWILQNERLVRMGHGSGITKEGESYNHRIASQTIDNVVNGGGTDAGTGRYRDADEMRSMMKTLSRSSNAAEVSMAHELLKAYQGGGYDVEFDVSTGQFHYRRSVADSNGVETPTPFAGLIIPPNNPDGTTRTTASPSDMDHRVRAAQRVMDRRGDTGSNANLVIKGGFNAQYAEDRSMIDAVDHAVMKARKRDQAAGSTRNVTHEAQRQMPKRQTPYTGPGIDGDPST